MPFKNPWGETDTVCGKFALSSGTEKYCASFPPKVNSLELLGCLSDKTKQIHCQGNGRSSMLGQQVFYLFDKTFCKDQNGNQLAEIPNSAAIVPEPETKPLRSLHPSLRSGDTKPFLQLTRSERQFEIETGKKVILSAHGGVCEAGGSKGDKGYIWYKKSTQERNSDGTLTEVYHGTGVAAVEVEKGTGQLISRRLINGKLLFNQHEPAFGTFCAVQNENWYYLWGKLGDDIYLSRIAQWIPIQSQLYEFWDGCKFVPYITEISPVFTGYSSGSIYQTKLFGHSYKWVFIGKNQQDRPLVSIGCSQDIYGPFKMSDLIYDDQLHPAYRGINSLYTHSWAMQERIGQLLVTWNENTSANIVGVKLQFDMLHQGAFWKDISLENLPTVISGLVIGRDSTLKSTAHQTSNVHCEIASTKENKATIKLLGTTADAVDKAASNICSIISNWCEELTRDGELAKKIRERGFVLKP